MKNEKLLRLVRELLKNSKRSDREIAKRLGLSQATITRTRVRLQKEGYIKTYTVIPDFVKLGYEILAFTFSKMKSYPTTEEIEKIVQRAREWVDKHPNIIFSADGQGLGGKDVMMISFHKNYSNTLISCEPTQWIGDRSLVNLTPSSSALGQDTS